jgi:hypothetical protein
MKNPRRMLVQVAVLVVFELIALLLPARAQAASRPLVCGPVCASSCLLSCDYLTDGRCPVDNGCFFSTGCPGGYEVECAPL